LELKTFGFSVWKNLRNVSHGAEGMMPEASHLCSPGLCMAIPTPERRTLQWDPSSDKRLMPDFNVRIHGCRKFHNAEGVEIQ
jgi:hypothetical protein